MELILKICGGYILGYTNAIIIGDAISIKMKAFNLYRILMSLTYSMFIIANYTILNGISRLLVGLIILTVIFNLVYEIGLYKAFISAIISYILATIGEIILVTVIVLIPNINNDEIIRKFVGTFFSNLVMSLLITIIYLILSKKIKHIIEWCTIKEDKIIAAISTIFILLIGFYFFKTYSISWVASFTTLASILTIMAFCFMMFLLLQEHASNNKIERDYENVLSYMKNSEQLIEEYQCLTHEYDNQLAIIQRLGKKEQAMYIGELLDSKNISETKWLNKLGNVPGGGLKGLFHYKILHMKQNEITVAISISVDFKKTTWDQKLYSDICKIVGVYLDNAIDAVSTGLKKEVIIEMYCNIDHDVISISNSCLLDVDIDKIYEKGYSTKGPKRGMGLYLVSSIIGRNSKIKKETKIHNGFFVQDIYIER